MFLLTSQQFILFLMSHKRQRVGNWHLSWQQHFQSIGWVEIPIGPRRADIAPTNMDFMVELQDSYIGLGEVQARNRDYNLYHKRVIWLLNGRDTVEIIPRRIGSMTSYLLFFETAWHITSFQTCDILLVQTDMDQIFSLSSTSTSQSYITI